MNNLKELQKIARKTVNAFEKKEENLHVKKAMGKFIAAGLLRHNKFQKYNGPVTLVEALAAGEIEPRIYELLPAVILKKPKLFRDTKQLPQDLKEVVEQIRKGNPVDPFRGVDPQKYMQWVDRIGHKNKTPTLLKTFRFQQDDIKTLNDLKKKMGLKEIEIIRKGLSLLHKKH